MPLAANRLSLYSLGSDPMGNTVFSCRVLFCYLTTSFITVHREHSSYCCVFCGTSILSRCLAMGICVTVHSNVPSISGNIEWDGGRCDNWMQRRIKLSAYINQIRVHIPVPIDKEYSAEHLLEFSPIILHTCSRDDTVGIARRATVWTTAVRFLAGTRFCSPSHPDRLWVPPTSYPADTETPGPLSPYVFMV
jgi:hypothetical protein